jgi:hypothetical protein
MHHSGAIAPRDGEAVFDERERATLSAVIVRESGRSSIPETLTIESRGRGVLDRPVKPDDDNSLWRSESDEGMRRPCGRRDP